MLKRVLSPGRQSKEQASTGGLEPALEQQQAGQRVVAAPVDTQATGGAATAALPPRPPIGLSPFDAPAEPAAKPALLQAAPAGLAQSMSGPPALGRPSVIKSYLSRDETRPDAAPALQQRLSQRLSAVSANPEVVASAKATLRREAAEVHSLPKVSSEDLLPCLESVLSFPRAGDTAAPCAQGKAEEREGLAEVGIDSQQAEAMERAVQ